jgi:hypothetical protein
LATAFGTWIVSPRFHLRPSLVDDWSAIARSPGQVHDMLRVAYHESGRFRPGFAVWNYLQWHTFDAPGGIVGPNVWVIARIVLLAGGLATFTAVLLQWRRRELDPIWELCLVTLPPFVVLTTPLFGIDLARFGPQEPALLGGMMLGGSLLFLGTRRLVGSGVLTPTVSAAALLVSGYVLWLFGTYQKETSVCALLLVPFLLLDHRSLRGRLKALDRRARRVLIVELVLVVLPILHVAYETIAIAARGELVYGMSANPTRHGVGHVTSVLRAMSHALGSRIGWLLLVSVLVGALVTVARRRTDWTVLGLYVTAVAALVWSSQSGFAASRYFIPTIGLLAVGLALLVAQLPWFGRLVAVAVVIGVAAASFSYGRNELSKWAATERRENAFVDTVAAVQATGCHIVVTGLDLERQTALPVLAALQGGRVGSCSDGSFFLVLGTWDADPATRDACAADDRELIGAWALGLEHAELDRCAHATPGSEQVLAAHRMS